MAIKQKLIILKRKLSRSNKWKRGVYLPGHYYHPIPSEADVKSISNTPDKNVSLDGVELNKVQQIHLLEKLVVYYKDFPFKKSASKKFRYYLNNNYFTNSDVIFLTAIMRYFQPKKIIEIGSGFSSAAMLDINDLYFNQSIDFTFIEPHPEERLHQLVKKDISNISILNKKVQTVDIQLFKTLSKNDILFVDSSHILKYGSDVAYILFKILPNLQSGTLIHFHDIFYPFEYPKDWLVHGRYFNEAYALHSFLMYNIQFEIILFPSYLEQVHAEWLKKHMPLSMELHEQLGMPDGNIKTTSVLGQSIWLRKK